MLGIHFRTSQPALAKSTLHLFGVFEIVCIFPSSVGAWKNMSNYQNVRSYYGINHRIRDLFSRDYFIFYYFWGGGGGCVGGGVVTKYKSFQI